MIELKTTLVALLVAACLATIVIAQTTTNARYQFSNDQSRRVLDYIFPSIESFSLKLFSEIQDTQAENNFMISPLNIWSLLLLIAEGTSGNALRQLINTLQLPDNRVAWRLAYAAMQKNLDVKSPSVNVSAMQAFFSDINSGFAHNFSTAMAEYYDVNLVPVDFICTCGAAARINEEIRRATDNFLDNVIQPEDLTEAQLVMLSTLYFKAKWQFPFQKMYTNIAPFYNEDNSQIGNVVMMVNYLEIRATHVDALESAVVEMPFEKSNSNYTMMLILPDGGNSVTKTVKKLRTIGIGYILEKLHNYAEQNTDEDGFLHQVLIKMPKFAFSSSFTLNDILRKMGLTDLFEEGNLQNISPKAKVSKVDHDTKIDVNEEGLSAAAVAKATVLDRMNRAFSYNFNRPFIYLIMDSTTNLTLFCGQVMHPKYEE